jgi:hypothetical protein
MRGVATAFCLFAADNKDRLPAVVDATVTNGEAWQKSWLTGRDFAAQENTDCASNAISADDFVKKGGLRKYYSSVKILRCPSLAEGTRGSGKGSNGRCDYQAFVAFSGAQISKMPTMAGPWLWWEWASRRKVRTPVLVDSCEGEDPLFGPLGYYKAGTNVAGSMIGSVSPNTSLTVIHPSTRNRLTSADGRVSAMNQTAGCGFLAALDGSVDSYSRGEMSDLAAMCWVAYDGPRAAFKGGVGFTTNLGWGKW